MVDLDVLEARAAAIAHHVGQVRALRPAAGVVPDADDVRWNALLMHLVQAIQACTDLASHTVAHESLGAPEGPASAFASLAQHGLLPQELAVKLAGAAGLRNVIVHRYGDVSAARILGELDRGLEALDAFARAMRVHGHHRTT